MSNKHGLDKDLLKSCKQFSCFSVKKSFVTELHSAKKSIRIYHVAFSLSVYSTRGIGSPLKIDNSILITNFTIV